MSDKFNGTETVWCASFGPLNDAWRCCCCCISCCGRTYKSVQSNIVHGREYCSCGLQTSEQQTAKTRRRNKQWLTLNKTTQLLGINPMKQSYYKAHSAGVMGEFDTSPPKSSSSIVISCNVLIGTNPSWFVVQFSARHHLDLTIGKGFGNQCTRCSVTTHPSLKAPKISIWSPRFRLISSLCSFS